jgi:hypothetical protein
MPCAGSRRGIPSGDQRAGDRRSVLECAWRAGRTPGRYARSRLASKRQARCPGNASRTLTQLAGRRYAWCPQHSGSYTTPRDALFLIAKIEGIDSPAERWLCDVRSALKSISLDFVRSAIRCLFRDLGASMDARTSPFVILLAVLTFVVIAVAVLVGRGWKTEPEQSRPPVILLVELPGPTVPNGQEWQKRVVSVEKHSLELVYCGAVLRNSLTRHPKGENGFGFIIFLARDGHGVRIPLPVASSTDWSFSRIVRVMELQKDSRFTLADLGQRWPGDGRWLPALPLSLLGASTKIARARRLQSSLPSCNLRRYPVHRAIFERTHWVDAPTGNCQRH